MKYRAVPRIEFTREMKKTHTILVPNMLPIHMQLVCAMFARHGYKTELLSNEGSAVVDAGLKYVHNDTCYPALLCIGQMIDALESGRYDLERVALIMIQTAGGCRASNYIYLLRKALIKAGFARVPVISLNLSKMEKNSGFNISASFVVDAFCLLLYGDMMMLLENQIAPYEVNPGESERVTQTWIRRLSEQLGRSGGIGFLAVKRNLEGMARDYGGIKVEPRERTRVGIVGEIYVKYFPLANNHLAEFLREQGCEVMTPGIISFFAYMVDTRIDDILFYGGNPFRKLALRLLLNLVERNGQKLIDALKGTRFIAPPTYAKLKEMVSGVLGYGTKMGEGWMLPAEIIELTKSGYRNVVCAQPFGCLPNHIVGRGVFGKLRSMFPEANIMPVDYDPGATRVNQENRIKLMLAVASGERAAPAESAESFDLSEAFSGCRACRENCEQKQESPVT